MIQFDIIFTSIYYPTHLCDHKKSADCLKFIIPLETF